MNRFKHQTVIVTGAASGVGLGVALRFSSKGATVVVFDLEAGDLDKAASEQPADRTLTPAADVSKFEQVQALLVAAVERFGGVDVMVNIAGIGTEGSVLEVSLEGWGRTIDNKLGGAFHGCRAAMPELLKTQGCIVNTAAVSGLGADWGLAGYNAAKGGVVNRTRSLAMDFCSRGVRATRWRRR